MEINKYLWHLSVHKYYNEYHAFFNVAPASTNAFTLNFAKSLNGVDWTVKTTPIITPSITGWDNSYIYRGYGIINQNNQYDLWYSARNSSGVWHVGRTIVNLYSSVSTTVEPTTTIESATEEITTTI
jgi:predicted GH43/DUF377 family glycosyl hydrolase